MLRRELGEFLCEIGVGREDWCSSWGLVDNVNQRCTGCAVLLKKSGDGFAGGSDILRLEVAISVPL